MTSKKLTVFFLSFGLLTSWLGSDSVEAQVVSLPTLRIFNVRTAVSVPDGGAIQTGGVNRYSSGSVSRGTPILGDVPGVGRLFKNRAIVRDGSSNSVTVRPRLIIMSELEEDVLAEAAWRNAQAAKKNPNGPAAVQKKANFITRNIGRNKKR